MLQLRVRLNMAWAKSALQSAWKCFIKSKSNCRRTLYQISLAKGQNRICAFHAAVKVALRPSAAATWQIFVGRECDAELVVGAGMVDVRMDETVTNIRDTSSSQAGRGPSRLPSNTTAAVQLETKHMTSVSAQGDPTTGADSMNLPSWTVTGSPPVCKLHTILCIRINGTHLYESR